jgi:hypothetical protein
MGASLIAGLLAMSGVLRHFLGAFGSRFNSEQRGCVTAGYRDAASPPWSNPGVSTRMALTD